MSENNLSSIISSLASNKDFAKMVEHVKESGDLSSILGEVSSLFGGDPSSGNVPSDDTSVGEASDTYDVDEAQEKSFTQGEDARKNDSHEKEATEAGLLLGGKDDGLDMGSLLGGLLPMFSKSILENSALLIALKPYLSKRRCDLIDSLIKISKLASIVSLAK